MASPRRGFGWRLWLCWVLATTAATSVIGALILGLTLSVGTYGALESITDTFTGRVVFHGMVGGVVGIVIGFSQWLVLRHRMPKAGWWVLASAVGLAFGNSVSKDLLWNVWPLVMPPNGGDVWDIVWAMSAWGVSGAVGGTVVGVAQWLALRKQIRQAGWWVLASVVGWAVAAIAGQFAGSRMAAALHWRLSWIVPTLGLLGGIFLGVGDPHGYPVIGAVAGATTGLVLVWLLQRRR